MRARNRNPAGFSAAVAAVAASFAVPSVIPRAGAQTSTTVSVPAQPIAVHVAEASRRFNMPEAWIYAVMGVESAGDPAAVSHKGAIGLMQVMPATYAELRGRYGLGPNAFGPRNNILAGTAFLREMYDRYGAPGFLAAYNAGPGRYEEYLAGRALPRETRAYVARLAPRIGGSPEAQPAVVQDPLSWTRASLFAGGRSPTAPASQPASAPPFDIGSSSSEAAIEAPTEQRLVSLFVPLSGRRQ